MINQHHSALTNVPSSLTVFHDTFSFSECFTSSFHSLNIGIPQLSILTPLVFSFYMLFFGNFHLLPYSVPVYVLITPKLCISLLCPVGYFWKSVFLAYQELTENNHKWGGREFINELLAHIAPQKLFPVTFNTDVMAGGILSCCIREVTALLLPRVTLVLHTLAAVSSLAPRARE